jgi:hypothetical protein
VAGPESGKSVRVCGRCGGECPGHQLNSADTLVTGFPRLLAACTNGTVSLAAARVVADETATLTTAQQRRIDVEVTADAQTMTPGRLRTATRYRVIEVDPDAAANRELVARAKRNVHIIAHPDGVGTLAALLHAEEAVACHQVLDAYARGRRADGDQRTIAELMADTLVERITGISKPTDMWVEVQMVIAASSLLGETTQPAIINGYGAITPTLARALAAGASTFARRLVCDPIDGQLIHTDTHRRCFDGALRRYLHAADQVCRMPVCEAPIRHLDHIHEHRHGGPTSGINAQGLCRGCHTTKHSTGWIVDIETASAQARFRRPGLTWITPTGYRYYSRPPPALGPGSINRRQPAYTSPLETQFRRILDDAA